MTDLNSELAWEQNMLTFGIDRFRAQERKTKERKDFTATNGGRRLLKSYLSQVSEFIAHYCAGNNPGGRRRSKYTPIIEQLDPDKLALFTLTEMISSVFDERLLSSAANKVGVMVEDELKFSKFNAELPDLFVQLTRDMDNRNSNDYRYRHRVLSHYMNKEGVQWERWGVTMCVQVGMLLISLALDATDILTKETIRSGKKSRVVLKARPEVLDWLERSDDAVAAMLPDRMPTLIAPEDWQTIYDGGYHLPRLRCSTTLVKFRRGRAGKEHQNIAREAQIPAVMGAVNAMQRTPWRINSNVLRAVQAVWDNNLEIGMPASQPYQMPKSPIPEGKKNLTPEEQETLDAWKGEAREVHTLEKQRRGMLYSIARSMRLGTMLAEQEQIHYVYQLDFRGRVYAASSGVSPQGNDVAKALLEFGEAKPLGERGLYWLCVHGANKYGEDKCSYDERVAWITARRDQWVAAANDPIANRDAWKDADKPFQFLAFCFEYRDALELGPDFRSRLPVALDGSCNGLQHFSAMLRDPVGGRAVNLTAAERPSDIYQDVADVCTAKLRAAAAGTDGPEHVAQNWLALLKKLGYSELPRKAAKKPVMTLPYGSTQQACTSSLFAWYMEQRVEFFPEGTAFRHCIFLSQLLWESIGEVVVAARAAMDWIQQCAGQLAKHDLPLLYHTHLGLPVYQGSPNTEDKRICHRIGGTRVRLTIKEEIDGLNGRRQRQGSSPNLVHSVDATHMMMCINAGVQAGITSFAMIHDDFGTHACHIDEWHRIIREEFIRLHTDFDVLAAFKAEHEARHSIELPDLPAKGSLDLAGVAESPYFFG
jgi:DNA-directed RNA polymerase